MSRTRAFVRIAAIALLGSSILAACDSSEDRAEEHYQSAVELVEKGDNERAVVELRNALQLDRQHTDARRLFAVIAEENGNIQSAYGHLLAVVEMEPEDLVARQQLAELAVRTQNWDQAERHGRFLIEAQAEGSAELPERTEVVTLALNFREAVLADDASRIRELVTEAESLYEKYPGNEVIERLLIEGYMRDGRQDDALEVIDVAVEEREKDRRLYDMRLAILSGQQDEAAIEDELKRMLEVFPDDPEVRSNLVRLYIATGRYEDAENFMRSLIDESEAGLGALVSLVAFLRETEGIETALAELQSAIDARETPEPQLLALRAGLRFDLGERDEAIAEMESLLEKEENSELRLGWKVALAKMLQTTGNDVGARKHVEEVLATDPVNPAAVKMQAEWQIAADEIEAAISSLRGALDQAPEDPEILLLLSRAHARAGETELAEEMLSLAVDASNYAIEPSLAYARQLLAAENYRSAEDVLVNALRNRGNDVRLLETLGGLYLAEEDYARASQVENTLRRMENDLATRTADTLKVQILNRREGRDSAVSYLEGLVADSEDDIAARIALIRARLASGENEAALELARNFAEDQGADTPEGRLVLAAALLATGNLEEAEAKLQEVVEATPENVRAWTQLLRVENAQGKTDEARATMEAGLQANPGAPDLLWAKASMAEAEGDIDAAIEIYEGLYEDLSGSVVVANNLASLLATYRDDEESLERAYTVARRLRGTEVPPFQDTYGWILYRRGDVEEAISYLEPAAEGLPNDPIVQYHLGRALRDAGREEEALAAFRRALDVAPEGDDRQQIADARAAVEDLEATE